MNIHDNPQLLNVDRHRRLRWRCLGAECPVSCCCVPQRSSISVVEILTLSKYFPIHFPLVLREDGSKGFELNVVFKLPGASCCAYLISGKGCILGEEKPLACKQYPFQVVKTRDGQNVVRFFLACPGFSEEEGTPIFQDYGVMDPYFHEEFIKPSLLLMNTREQTQDFVRELVEHDLIVGGFYRYRDIQVSTNFVDENRLINLPKNVLTEFSKKGYLKLIYAHLNSLDNFKLLIDKYIEECREKGIEPQKQIGTLTEKV